MPAQDKGATPRSYASGDNIYSGRLSRVAAGAGHLWMSSTLNVLPSHCPLFSMSLFLIVFPGNKFLATNSLRRTLWGFEHRFGHKLGKFCGPKDTCIRINLGRRDVAFDRKVGMKNKVCGPEGHLHENEPGSTQVRSHTSILRPINLIQLRSHAGVYRTLTSQYNLVPITLRGAEFYPYILV